MFSLQECQSEIRHLESLFEKGFSDEVKSDPYIEKCLSDRLEAYRSLECELIPEPVQMTLFEVS